MFVVLSLFHSLLPLDKSPRACFWYKNLSCIKWSQQLLLLLIKGRPDLGILLQITKLQELNILQSILFLYFEMSVWVTPSLLLTPNSTTKVLQERFFLMFMLQLKRMAFKGLHYTLNNPKANIFPYNLCAIFNLGINPLSAGWQYISGCIIADFQNW